MMQNSMGKFHPSRDAVYSFFLLFASPILVFYGLEWMTHNPWESMTVQVQIWNILFYEMVTLLLFFLTRRVRLAVRISTLFFLAVGLVNYFVLSFRSTPLVPWDIFSLRTAMSVAGSYSYTISLSCGVVLVLFVLLLAGSHFCHFTLPKGRPVRRLLCVLAFLLLMGGYTALLHQDSFVQFMKMDQTLFTPAYMARKDGFTTSFLIDLQYLKVDTPDGYSAGEAQSLLSSYEEEEEPASTPNIIVIMDETFSDPAILGDFTVNTDYMPFFHSLMQGAENTITGWLNVSVKGGNTANTEYEFLTGNTMRFLPGGSIPYQQYIFSPKDSLVSWLTGLGYQTASIHPYNSTGWNRDRVYADFGFGRILFNADFTDPERVRKYISDAACFSKIIQTYQEKEADTPLFCFAVTMQNHGGYSEDFDNFTVDVAVEDASSERLNRYLSLMKLTDQALQDLISFFSEEAEKTVLVFFGDHQPNDIVVEPIWAMQGKQGSELDASDEALRYKVPYLIWANFPIGDSSGTETSVNYLAAQVLQAAGLPLSDYQQFLLDLAEDYPVLSTQRLTDSSGQEIAESDAGEALRSYRILQYYQMFDRDPDD